MLNHERIEPTPTVPEQDPVQEARDRWGVDLNDAGDVLRVLRELRSAKRDDGQGFGDRLRGIVVEGRNPDSDITQEQLDLLKLLNEYQAGQSQTA